MREIDYSSWADYIIDLIDLYPFELKRLLELGAGDCKSSFYINQNFSSYFVSDLSLQMLKVGDDKLKKVVADMRRLPFKKEFDVIFSIFDSVNYLLTGDDFVSFLSESKRILSQDGIITFDASLEKNSTKNIKRLNRKGKFSGIKYKQESYFDKKTRIHSNIVNMKIDDVDYLEKHEQMIYEFEEYFVFAEEANLRVIDCFDCFTFDDAKRNSERVQFVLGNI